MNTIQILIIKLVIFVLSTISLTARSQSQAVMPGKINFTNFSVTIIDKKIRIDWSTDKAVATNYFELQKSQDGTTYRTIALILGPDPKKEKECDCYGCFDLISRKLKKLNYYRVRHVDLEGNEQFSIAKEFNPTGTLTAAR